MTVDLLVTGAAGQVGWELERRAAGAGFSFRAAARGALDIADRDQVLSAVAAAAPKIVVNTAAYTAVDKAESDPAAAFASNRDGPAHLAEACAQYNAILIHLSTDYVFDGAKPGPYVESDTVGPVGVYGDSKLAGEEAVRARLSRHVILRTAWVYGVHGNNFVKTMLRLGRERPVLRVVDDQHGCPTYAADLADAILAIARRLTTHLSPHQFGTFNCVGAGAVSWCGFARHIIELAGARLGNSPRVEAITTAEYQTPARRPANSVLGCAKMAATYGLSLRPWQPAVKDMVDAVLAGT